MTYSCTLKNQASSVTVDFDKTWAEGAGPHLSITNEIAVLDAPLDADGNSVDSPMDMKYCPVKVLISGQFKDGLGTMDWLTPGSTKSEKLVNLQKLEIVPLVLTWPVTTKSFYCVIERLDLGEQGGFGDTVTYDITLRITGAS